MAVAVLRIKQHGLSAADPNAPPGLSEAAASRIVSAYGWCSSVVLGASAIRTRASVGQGILVTLPCCRYDDPMAVAEYRVSGRGQMALPAEARHRWHLNGGGSVEVADLGEALLIVPAGRGGLRGLLRDAIEEAGGYAKLAAEVAADDPDLA
jgi:bifunctional DNA-binding transcriptional regulator/antitoxin component of YhaV-PrlF toxin-antitoxin module